MRKIQLFGCLAIFVVNILSPCQSRASQKIIDNPEHQIILTDILRGISDWIVDVELRTGTLKIEDKLKTSIFVNSNLARVLIAAYEITGETRYLDEALSWFDRLVELQQITVTARGDTAGFWGDLSPDGNIYLGDAGTASTALAGAVRMATGARKDKYLLALRRYAKFAQEGSKDDPQGKSRGGSPGWVISEGADRGAIGCGYYRGSLSTYPYTISTGATGAGFFSAFYKLAGNREYLEIAEGAVRWLLQKRLPDGEIPYILHNFSLDDWPVNTMSYVSDGIIGLYTRTDDQELKDQIKRVMSRSVQWLLNRNMGNGVWGRMRSPDQQRSQGALNLMIWYYTNVQKHPLLLEGIKRNYKFFLNPENVTAFGVKELPIATGFVGLALAELLEPGIIYRI